jgi:hypothetical protein
MPSVKVPSQTITYLMICVGAIIAFILMALYPYHKSLANMDLEIERIETQIAEQKILSPFFMDMLSKVELGEPQGLPFTDRARPTRIATGKIEPIFRVMAQKFGLKVIRIEPDVASLIEDTGYLRVNLTVSGAFPAFRDYLLRLGELPYLEHVEQVKIQASNQGPKALELALKIWVSQE